MVATILSAAAAVYFVIPPAASWRLPTSADVAGAVLFLGVCTFISILNETLRNSRATSEQRLQDLTQEIIRRSRVEQTLADSRRDAERARDLLQTTLASIGDAVIATDAKGIVTFLNTVAADLTGWSQSEAAGVAVTEVFSIRHEKTGAAVESPVDQALRGGSVVRLADHTVLAPKGGRAPIPIEDSAAPIRDQDGRLLGAVLVFRDVTARRRSAVTLEQQWHTFDTALSHTPDFTYVFDLQGRFTYVNRALLSLWQKPLEEAVGKDFFDLGYPTDLAARLQRQIQQVIDTRRSGARPDSFYGTHRRDPAVRVHLRADPGCLTAAWRRWRVPRATRRIAFAG